MPERGSCRGFGTVEHDHVADAGDEVAAGFLGELGGEFLFLILELVEFHLEQFVMFEGVIKGGDELRGETFLADAERGFEELAPGFEVADFGVVEQKHGDTMTKSGRRGHDKSQPPGWDYSPLFLKAHYQSWWRATTRNFPVLARNTPVAGSQRNG